MHDKLSVLHASSIFYFALQWHGFHLSENEFYKIIAHSLCQHSPIQLTLRRIKQVASLKVVACRLDRARLRDKVCGTRYRICIQKLKSMSIVADSNYI